jgi:hypothetical protein
LQFRLPPRPIQLPETQRQQHWQQQQHSKS